MAKQDWKIQSCGALRDVFWNEEQGLSMCIVRDGLEFELDGRRFWQEIPGKGEIERRIAVRWHGLLGSLRKVEFGKEMPYVDVRTACLPASGVYGAVYNDFDHESFRGRRLLLSGKVETLKVLCLVQGYLTGATLRSYRETGKVYGVELPEGLNETDKLPEPIVVFVPRETDGATRPGAYVTDEECTQQLEEMFWRYGELDYVQKMKEIALKVYQYARACALGGVVLAQAKFEFTICQDDVDHYLNPMLTGEILTPSCATFWDEHEMGRDFVRRPLEDFLMTHPDYINSGRPLPMAVTQRVCSRYGQLYHGRLFW